MRFRPKELSCGMIANAYYDIGFSLPIAYNDGKVKEGTAVLILAVGRVAEGRNTAERVRIMESSVPADGAVARPATHIYVCPHPGDRLNESRYRDLAESLIRHMHYDGQSVLVYLHADILRDHMHIVTSAYDDHGGYVRPSRERGIIQETVPVIEREMGLCSLRVSPGAIAPLPESVALPRAVPELGYTSVQIGVALATVTARFRFLDLDGLNAILRVYGIAMRRCISRTTGKTGFYYRIIGKPNVRRVKASAFRPRFDMKSIRRMILHSVASATAAEHVGEAVRASLDGSGNDFEAFCRELGRRDIEVIPAIWQARGGGIPTLVFLDRTTSEAHSQASLGIVDPDELMKRFGQGMAVHAYPTAGGDGIAAWSAIMRSVLSAQGIPMSRFLAGEVTITDIVAIGSERRVRHPDSASRKMSAETGGTGCLQVPVKEGQ